MSNQSQIPTIFESLPRVASRLLSRTSLTTSAPRHLLPAAELMLAELMLAELMLAELMLAELMLAELSLSVP